MGYHAQRAIRMRTAFQIMAMDGMDRRAEGNQQNADDAEDVSSELSRARFALQLDHVIQSLSVARCPQTALSLDGIPRKKSTNTRQFSMINRNVPSSEIGGAVRCAQAASCNPSRGEAQPGRQALAIGGSKIKCILPQQLGPRTMLTENETSIRSAPVVAPAMQVRLLADDLTGACDAGAAFLKAGYSVRVWLGPAALFPVPEAVQAVHTSSRSLPADEAAKAVGEAAASLRSGTGTTFFKKIDSAGRGPIAAEVLAAHRALATRAILLAPAFPAAGRTVRHGILQIRDECGQNARVNLAELFAAEMRGAMSTISDPGEVAAAIERGATLLVCDSATQDELNALARAAEPLQSLLYAGSAGLALALANLHPAPAPPAPTAAAARALVVVGTEHPVTALQLATLERAVQGHKDIRFLRIACRPGDDAGVGAAFASFDPEALILTGGDTAQLAAHALGAHSILLCGEFAPGIPWGRLQGGVAEGRIVVTKSGGFGSATALNEVVAKLSGAA